MLLFTSYILITKYVGIECSHMVPNNQVLLLVIVTKNIIVICILLFDSSFYKAMLFPFFAGRAPDQGV